MFFLRWLPPTGTGKFWDVLLVTFEQDGASKTQKRFPEHSVQ